MKKISESRKTWLNKNIKTIYKLYPNKYKIYGPYLSKDNRYRVVLYDGLNRTTKQYAKIKMEIKMEIKIGKRLLEPLTVDHIDGNVKNDKFSNLQILTRDKNAEKSANTKYIVKYAKSKEGRKQSKIRFIENNPKAIFNDKTVIKLRKDYSSNTKSLLDLANEYNTGVRTIRDMLRGYNYSYLPYSIKLGYGGLFIRYN